MICFFWDLTSLRKRSTKSSGLVCEASIGAVVFAASFLAGVESWAKTQLADASTTNFKVIARNFFWIMGSFHLWRNYSSARMPRGLNHKVV
jgi:hypothetical protein